MGVMRNKLRYQATHAPQPSTSRAKSSNLIYVFMVSLLVCSSLLYLDFLLGTSSILSLEMVGFTSWISTLTIPLYYAANTNAIAYSPIPPPSYPLAVRNPYLSVWLPGEQVANLPTAKPQFWYGNDLGWSVLANVNGQTYNLFGVSSPASNTKSASVISADFTSTHSIFTVNAGAASFTLDFFSPISFHNYVRQSLPFSYLSITASSLNGAANDIDIYSDIDESWTGSSATNCSMTASGGTYIYEFSANGATYSQSSTELALWGKVVFAASQSGSNALSTLSGPSIYTRGLFQTAGNLSTSNMGATCRTGGAYGFAYRLGRVSQTTTVRFAAGVVREDAINYLGSAQTHYYRSSYPDIQSAVTHFFDDYDAAASEASDLDSTIQNTAASLAGPKYSDILAISARQIFGGIDVTIPADTLDTTQVQAFIKEISSDGNVNTIDIIFPTFPFFYVFAPEYIKLMLDPIMRYLASGRYPNRWVIHDIGASYPNATGHDAGNDEAMPIEETGNLFILLDAYEKASGNKTWRTQYDNLLPGYAQYLVNNGLYPAYQLSTTDGLGAFGNMTSLAIKAAVGLSAYGSLSGQQNWTAIGKSFADTINTPGVGVFISSETGKPYFDLTYDNQDWYLTFNIYPDQLLNLATFNSSTFSAQSDFYPTVRGTAGVAIDSDALWGKTDWDFWVAATSSDSTKEMFVNDVHAYIANGKNTQPFSDRYYVKGDQAGLAAFRARPTLGAHWAIWALVKGPKSG